jgi:TRAP-type C4-dicarboxylate transport system permease small subunit
MIVFISTMNDKLHQWKVIIIKSIVSFITIFIFVYGIIVFMETINRNPTELVIGVIIGSIIGWIAGINHRLTSIEMAK